MSGGALTWINARMSAAEELGVRPWVSWQAFEKALKAQFEPLSKEERARSKSGSWYRLEMSIRTFTASVN